MRAHEFITEYIPGKDAGGLFRDRGNVGVPVDTKPAVVNTFPETPEERVKMLQDAGIIADEIDNNPNAKKELMMDPDMLNRLADLVDHSTNVAESTIKTINESLYKQYINIEEGAPINLKKERDKREVEQWIADNPEAAIRLGLVVPQHFKNAVSQIVSVCPQCKNEECTCDGKNVIDFDRPISSNDNSMMERILKNAGLPTNEIDEGKKKKSKKKSKKKKSSKTKSRSKRNANVLVGSGRADPDGKKTNPDSKAHKKVRTPGTGPKARTKYNHGAKAGANPGFVGG